MKTLIRADSSSVIGLGHIMRCITLAKSLDGEVLFASMPLAGNIIDKIPFETKRLKTNEPSELIELINALNIGLLVIDHYSIDAAFEREIKDATGVKILSFDDTYTPHHCDILLNHNIYADSSRYASLVPKGCELRCGGDFTLIRDEFKEEKKHPRAKQYDLLIAMGGTDATNLTQAILSSLPNALKIAVLTTSANAHLNALQDYARTKEHITLLINSNEVAKVMNQSRFAILTPSGTVHEALFMGISFIAIKVAENQNDMFNYLKKEGYTVLERWDEKAFLEQFNAKFAECV